MVGSNIYFYRLDKIVGRRKYGEAVVDRGGRVRYNNHHHNNNNNNNHTMTTIIQTVTTTTTPLIIETINKINKIAFHIL